MRTIVYIDGFNLYYRLLQKRPALKWVNPALLSAVVLRTRYQVTKVRYFTARVSGRLDADAPRRQQIYLDALETVPEIEIHYGHFLEKPKYASLYKPTIDRTVAGNDQLFRPWPDVVRIWKTEEKGSDVNLATYLLLDAFRDAFDEAAVLSNDSDLAEPIRIVNKALGKPVGLLSPVNNPTPELRTAAAWIKHVKPSHAARALFADPVITSAGATIQKPSSWI